MDNLYKNKKILIFGLGLNDGGVGAAKFFARNKAEVRVTDLKSKEILQPSLEKLKEFKSISYTLGEHRFEDIDWADIIIRNPAVKPGNKYIEYALKKGKEVEMEMGIFLNHVRPDQIIGVTGSKGKSTTTSLIYEALKAAGKDAVLAGNIGRSVLEVIPEIKENTLVVLEISSFQLESFDIRKVSPAWAVITNIYQDHLNYYKNMDEYRSAKKVISKYQTEDDFLFIKKDDQTVDQLDFLKGFKAKIIRFSKDDLPEDFKPVLLGEHNRENISAAYQVCSTFNINTKILLKSLAGFTGVPLRMELVKNWQGFKIYNDSAATSPDATIQALKTLGPKDEDEEPDIILICGGMNKGMDYTEFAKAVSKYAKKVYFLAGDSTDEIKKKLEIRNSKLEIRDTYSNLETVLNDIKKKATANDTILFSPAATSFNLFQNEFDRGRKFNEAVSKVFGSNNI